MVVTLGNVIYWVCSAAALLFYVSSALRSYPLLSREEVLAVQIRAIAISGLIWLLGRAIRYVLAGR